ncbi:MAG: hypothetical protein ACOVS5_12460, partial [Oligoflexus sp.]
GRLKWKGFLYMRGSRRCLRRAGRSIAWRHSGVLIRVNQKVGRASINVGRWPTAAPQILISS